MAAVDTWPDLAKTVTTGTGNLLRSTSSKERTTLTITAATLTATATLTGTSVTTPKGKRTGTKTGTKTGIGMYVQMITSEEETMMVEKTTDLGVGPPEAIKTTATTTMAPALVLVHRLLRTIEEKVFWFLSVMSSERMMMAIVLGTTTAMTFTTET